MSYLIAIPPEMFTTLLSVHVNISSSDRVGLVPLPSAFSLVTAGTIEKVTSLQLMLGEAEIFCVYTETTMQVEIYLWRRHQNRQ